MNTTIIINPYCHQGQGWKRWQSIQGEVMKIVPGAYLVVLETGMNPSQLLASSLLQGKDHHIIAAGGDGTVHEMVNMIFGELQGYMPLITLGAIGLGSSNDFHKPFKQKIFSIPVRIGFDNTILHDIGTVSYADVTERQCSKHFIINASLGVTAYGNRKFNAPGPLLGWLKRHSIPLAIVYTALSTLSQYRNLRCRIQINGESFDKEVTNINILKLPYVSGQFRYDQDIRPDDGNLSVNISHGMNLPEMVEALYRLGNGRLIAGKKTCQAFCKELAISMDSPVVMECDGETFFAKNINISIQPKAIRVTQN